MIKILLNGYKKIIPVQAQLQNNPEIGIFFSDIFISHDHLDKFYNKIISYIKLIDFCSLLIIKFKNQIVCKYFCFKDKKKLLNV